MPPFGSPGNFPTSAQIGWAPSHYRKREPDVSAVVVRNEFDDGGASFFTLNTAAPESWELIWEGLTNAEADIIEAHYRNAWTVYTFSWVDKAGATQTGLRYLEYERTHEANRSWIQRVRVVLIKYP